MNLTNLFAVLSMLIVAGWCDVVRYERPSIYSKSAHFSLQVDGTQMYTVSYAGYDYVHLSMDQGRPVEFRIKTLSQGSTIKSYSITPKQLPIEARVEKNELVWTMKKAHYLIVKIDDLKEFVIMVDPMETDVPKSKGSGIFNVMDYKADNTGNSLTKGIQDAMDAAAKKPGSIVYVPAGLYKIGNLMLRDKTSLYLAGGSVLRFSGNPSDYKKLFHKDSLFDGTWWIQTEFDSSDIKVYGRGTIDGNGKNTRANKYIATPLVPVGTKNFRCDGVLVRDSSFWGVTPIQVEDALLTNIKVLNRHDVTEDDGIDVVESQRVTVRRSIAIGNDDSYSTKTWPYKTGTTVPYPYAPRPLNDVLFEDCVAWTRCYGFKVGQGVHQIQQNVTFRDGTVYYAGVGLGIHHLFGTDKASGVTFQNMDVEKLGGSPSGRATWLAIWIANGGRGMGPIEDILIKNIKVRDQGKKNGFLQGWNSTVKTSDVTFSDVYMPGSSKPATSLKQMNLINTTYSENIRFANTK